MKKNEKLVIGLICVIAIGMVSLPLFGGTLFAVEGQDTFFHTQRIWSIKNALESGQFPVRIYKEIYDGYGYGASLYYPDLFLYVPAILCMLGLPLTLSYNLFLLIVNALTLCIAFYSFSKITDSKVIGLIAALLYELCSYRMLDLYTRASIGEVLALMFCPLALCGLDLIAKGEYQKWWILGLAFSGLLQSHILTFVMMTIMAVCYVLTHYKAFFRAKAVGAVLLAALVTTLLNGWFLVPFFQASQTKVIAMINNSGFWNTDASLAEIFDILLLSVAGTESWSDMVAGVMPKTPGITLILGGLLTLFALIIYKNEMTVCKKQAEGYLAAGIFATFMITNLFPWKLVEKIAVLSTFFTKFQFIWRMNVLAVLFLSIAAAYGIYYFFVHGSADSTKAWILVSLILCAFSLIFVNRYVQQAGQYVKEEVLQKGYMDRLYVVPGFAYGSREDLTSNFTDITFTDVERENCEIQFHFDTANGEFMTDEADVAFIEVPITYYPGYKVLLNGEDASYECSIWGVIRILIPENCRSGKIEVFYQESAFWRICEVISAMTAVALLGYILIGQFGGKKQ